MTELNIKKWLDSEAYERQKSIVNKDINELKQRYSSSGNPYVLDRHAAPQQLFVTDYSVFRKSTAEKQLVKEFKKILPKTKHYKFISLTKFSV